MEKRKLEMEFLNEMGKKHVISIDNPRIDLNPEEVQTAMDAIITNNVFIVSLGELVESVESRIVTTHIEKLTE